MSSLDKFLIPPLQNIVINYLVGDKQYHKDKFNKCLYFIKYINDNEIENEMKRERDKNYNKLAEYYAWNRYCFYCGKIWGNSCNKFIPMLAPFIRFHGDFDTEKYNKEIISNRQAKEFICMDFKCINQKNKERIKSYYTKERQSRLKKNIK